ncbi:MAG: sensor histidine kinase [Almyronema sp.]
MALERSLQTVLLIDDNPNDRLLAVRELSREFPHLQIQEAFDWAAIERAFAADEFDLVITDYELHWATGLDVLQAVKAHDPNRPIIMFTDSGSQEVAVTAMKAGLDDYVLKSPKHLIRLSQAVRSVWEKAQIRSKASDLELRLQFLLNELEVGAFRSSLEGKLLEASDGLLRLLGLSSLAQAQAFFQTQLALQATDRLDDKRWQREVKLKNAAGKPLWLQVRATLIQFKGQSVIEGLVSNVTEQKETAAALRSLNQTLEQHVQERTTRLERLNHELEMFAFSVSHDLRSPIRQIDGFVSFLKPQLQSITTDETLLHYLQQISELTERSGKMIDDLLQFSRTGRVEMQFIAVNMERLVQEVKRQVAPAGAGRAIDWQIQPLPTVQGDRNLLRQVWQNLIENAVKYTSLQAQAEIVIGSYTIPGEVVFFVGDNGIGFDMNHAQRLFSIFQRLPNAQAFNGVGIGLANVQRVIHRHGGRLWAEAQLNQGATFYFSLPLVDTDAIA